MTNSLYVACILCCPLAVLSQSVQVDGSLKVTEMDTFNTENLLVVKRPDGTLAGRLVASLPPPAEDTTRTLQSDLFLTSAICNCPSLPPAMVQSLLDNGYSVSDLVDFQVAIPDLLEAGVLVPDLLNAGVTPLTLFDNGIPVIDLYGQTYGGGLIFYLDTMDVYPLFEGLIASPVDQSPGAEWGCVSTFIDGTESGIGFGASNTSAIVLGCAESEIAARLCDELLDGTYDDWYLPSIDELNLMWENLADSDGNDSNSGPDDPNNLGGFSDAFYWSSTETDAFFASSQYFFNGNQSLDNKINSYYVRAARSY
jgi:hypothetical protein